MKYLFPISYFVTLLFIGCKSNTNNLDLLRKNIEQIISDKNAVVGVSIIGNQAKDTLSINGEKRFPMQSVFKLHIAMAMLSEVDKGRFSLDQEVQLTKNQLLPEDLWSPLRDEFPEGGSFTIQKLIEYAVSQSDNTACDVLIELLGSPKTVEDYIKKVGIQDIQITYNERDMQAEWDNMFQNWTTPNAASKTLQIFYENKDHLLSESSHQFIWDIHKSTATGTKRIKGNLPVGTVVAHKTGWSGTNKATGITDAINDIGIVFLPDGDYFIISVFITQSREENDTNERMIADISKVVYDYFIEIEK